MFVHTIRTSVSALAIGCLVVLGACDQNMQPSDMTDAAPKSAMSQTTTSSVAGITWTTPTGWTAQPERPMRIATYSVPAAAGDQEPGECAIFFFGPGEGGNVEGNVTRWQGQFKGPDGKTPELERGQSEINDLTVTTVSVEGTYLASMGPMVQSGTEKPGYKMLGAIIAAPEGNVFIKFTGPKKTIDEAGSAFKEMVDSVRK